MTNSETATEGGERRPTRILLVEDNPGGVYLLEKALRRHQIIYELRRYLDGETAIDALRRDDYGTPDLILLDLNLPRREGFDVLQVVRAKPALVGVPVGILTSSEGARDRHRVGLMGGSDTFTSRRRLKSSYCRLARPSRIRHSPPILAAGQ